LSFVVVVSHVSGLCEDECSPDPRARAITLVALVACIQLFDGARPAPWGKSCNSRGIFAHYLHIWSRISETKMQLQRPCNLHAKMVVWWPSFALNGARKAISQQLKHSVCGRQQIVMNFSCFRLGFQSFKLFIFIELS